MAFAVALQKDGLKRVEAVLALIDVSEAEASSRCAAARRRHAAPAPCVLYHL